MNIDVLLIQLLAFMAVFLLVIGIKAAFQKRGDEGHDRKPLLFRVFGHEILAFSRFLEPGVDQLFAGQTKQIRNDLTAGALPLSVSEVRGAQGFLAVCAGLAATVVVFLAFMNGYYALIALLAGSLLGWVYPVIFVTRTASRRKDAMSRSLPFAIDLITVAMQAGQDFGAAVRHLVNEGQKGPLQEEFSVALRQTELGKSRVEALKAMADRIQVEEFRSLVTAVIQSSEMGASIAQTMKIQAEEIRRARYHAAERKAARSPSLMLIPMALFILPAVFIIIFTPVVIRVIDSGVASYFGR